MCLGTGAKRWPGARPDAHLSHDKEATFMPKKNYYIKQDTYKYRLTLSWRQCKKFRQMISATMPDITRQTGGFTGTCQMDGLLDDCLLILCLHLRNQNVHVLDGVP